MKICPKCDKNKIFDVVEECVWCRTQNIVHETERENKKMNHTKVVSHTLRLDDKEILEMLKSAGYEVPDKCSRGFWMELLSKSDNLDNSPYCLDIHWTEEK